MDRKTNKSFQIRMERVRDLSLWDHNDSATEWLNKVIQFSLDCVSN